MFSSLEHILQLRKVFTAKLWYIYYNTIKVVHDYGDDDDDDVVVDYYKKIQFLFLFIFLFLILILFLVVIVVLLMYSFVGFL